MTSMIDSFPVAHGSLAASRHLLRQVQRTVLLCLAMPALAGTLSQTPLTNRVAAPPKPSVVFTIDDSGSMNTQYMPEGRFKIRPTDPDNMRVEFPSGSVANWPDWYMTDAFPGDISKDDGWIAACIVPALTDANEAVYQKQFRSPDVNSVFYNPDVRYLPWMQTSTTRYANASRTATLWEPTKVGSYNSLTTASVSHASGTVNWCSNTYVRSNNYGETCTGPWWNRVCSTAFRPGLVYRLNSATANPTLSASYTRYDINVNGSHAPAVKHPSRTDCAGTGCTMVEEQQNFANWFTYYRSRMHLTKAALAEVLAQTKNNVRVGLGSINQGVYTALKPARIVDGKLQSVMRMGVRELTDAHRNSLLTELRTITSAGGTPLPGALQAVGEYFQRSDNGNPWQSTPLDGSSAASQLACRRAFNILTTDGYYNAAGTLEPGNVDNTATGTAWPAASGFSVAGAPYGYTRALPYADSHSSTLADYAMHYFINDLRTDIPNQVPPNSSYTKAPYWQHLTQFTVGIGVTGQLDSRTALDTDGKSFRSKTLQALTAGNGTTWPDPAATDSAKIDDMWHAAVNTGGDFFSVKSASELKDALVSALDSVTVIQRKEAGVAASSKSVAAGVLKFVPTYESGAWSGDVLAYEMVSNAGQYDFSTTPKWKASDAVPAWAARNIYSWNGSAPVAFDTTNLDAPSKALISSDTAVQDALINYIRGDVSNEGKSAPQFRERYGKRLPDFLNSTPAYVKGFVDLKYPDAWYPSAPYSGFVTTKAARTSGAVFVGGGGGMLHAFSDTNGAELFAYAPRALFGNLAELSQQDYGTAANVHQYFVDGDLLETDAYIPTPRNAGNVGWANLIVGSYGAGGKGVFVLDVTNLGALGATTVLGERSQLDDADMGHIFSAPEVGRLAGTWFMFYGNGAYSTGGKAVLFATNLSTGENLKLDIETTAGSNGLMGVRALINSSTREVEALYGGDLLGNLWRVDFGPGAARSANVADWKVAFNNKPLFTAKSHANAAQPITVKPTLARNPLAGGRMVLFGTGKLFDTEDPDNKAMQSFYSVHDITAEGTSAATTDLSAWTAPVNHRDKLQQQTIDTTPVQRQNTNTGETVNFYKTSAETIDWHTQRGWFMDLTLDGGTANEATASGQRTVYDAVLVDDFVWISTIVPGAAPVDCGSTSGVGYNFLLPAVTGAMYTLPVLDTNGDGKVDDGDDAVSGIGKRSDGSDAVLAKPPFDGTDGTKTYLFSNTEDSNTGQTYCIFNCTRIIKDRIWRQLIDPPKPD